MMNDREAGTIRVRNLQAKVVEGTDGATLTTALNAYFEGAGEKTLVALHYVADYKMLVIFAE